MPRALAAPDKLRGTASAPEMAAAVAEGAAAAGWECDRAPLSDGGEGLLEAFGGPNRRTPVADPLGRRVLAEWRLEGDTAVVEMARASGLSLVGGAEGNDPLAASTSGTGELVAAAVGLGARRVVVGLGGSATTDGGLGCVEALRPHARLKGVELVAACDVRARFVEAAERFAAQKGATPAQVRLLAGRLERLAQDYERDLGRDVRDLPGSGAAGGLGGGLAALGAELVPGFDLVADLLEVPERVAAADAVVTAEGHLDAESFEGKVVGGVLELCAEASVPALVVVGRADPGRPRDLVARAGADLVVLAERYGDERARRSPLALTAEVVEGYLRSRAARR